MVFDEVHQLPDPSRLLKIGADEFPKLKILATGFSTLAATQKFRDSLTGRKRVIALVPVLHEELPAFGVTDVRDRLLRGGLPTVTNWLEVYQATQVIHLVRPFSGVGRHEIVAQPRVFGFNTGFTAHARSWDTLRAEDCGLLYEHLVLDALMAAGVPQLHFWRDQQQREVDFVLPRGRDRVETVECKWRPDAFETRSLAAFRESYPKGRNFVVSPLPGPGYTRVIPGLPIEFVTPAELRMAFAAK